jgi:hypothetical protein
MNQDKYLFNDKTKRVDFSFVRSGFPPPPRALRGDHLLPLLWVLLAPHPQAESTWACHQQRVRLGEGPPTVRWDSYPEPRNRLRTRPLNHHTTVLMLTLPCEFFIMNTSTAVNHWKTKINLFHDKTKGVPFVLVADRFTTTLGRQVPSHEWYAGQAGQVSLGEYPLVVWASYPGTSVTWCNRTPQFHHLSSMIKFCTGVLL